MRTAATIAVSIALLCSCGGKEGSSGPAATAVYETSSEGRIEVAKVNGVPIYDDCVLNQAHGLGLETEDEALQQCIDFEILAQAARDKGYLSHPSVVRTSRIESVRALIERVYPLTSAAGVPDEDLRHLWKTRGLRARYNHDEVRSAHLCLIKPGTDAKQLAVSARQLAQDVYDRMRKGTESGIALIAGACNAVKLQDAKQTAAHDVTLLKSAGERKTFAKDFADPLFALAEVGDYSGPHRAPQGWFVILMDNLIPLSAVPFDEAKHDIAVGLMTSKDTLWWRMGKFSEWYAQIAESHSIESFPERIPTGAP